MLNPLVFSHVCWSFLTFWMFQIPLFNERSASHPGQRYDARILGGRGGAKRCEARVQMDGL